jgi:hypothetical protein
MSMHPDPAAAAVFEKVFHDVASAALRVAAETVLTKIEEDPEQLPAACFAYHAIRRGCDDADLLDVEEVEEESVLGYFTRGMADFMGEYLYETNQWHKHERLDELVGKLLQSWEEETYGEEEFPEEENDAVG